MSHLLHVLALVRLPRDCASSRYRAYQFIEPLENHGIRLYVKSLYPEWLYKARKHSHRVLILDVLTVIIAFLRLLLYSISNALRSDIIFVVRDIAPFQIRWFIKFWKLFGKKIVFDFDDAIYVNSSRVSDYVRLADVVTAGNSYLAEWARKINPTTKVLPTAINAKYYIPKISYENKASITIGWIGSASTVPYLSAIVPVLDGLSNKYPLRFCVIGGELHKLDGVKTLIIRWSEETEVQEISKFDIGIAPMPDNEYTRGKCGLKVLQYMAAGVPVVASRVGVHLDIIKHGINGFLASTTDEWFNYLTLLIENVDIRKTLGERGRFTVKERFSLEKTSQELARIFKYLCNQD